MNKRANDPIDVHVGNRVRIARIAAALSQEELGGRLGLTFQQVQKYEKGTNRIAPSRLQVVANVTRKPVAWFFDGQPTGAQAGHPEPMAIERLGATRDGQRLPWRSTPSPAIGCGVQSLRWWWLRPAARSRRTSLMRNEPTNRRNVLAAMIERASASGRPADTMFQVVVTGVVVMAMHFAVAGLTRW